MHITSQLTRKLKQLSSIRSKHSESHSSRNAGSAKSSSRPSEIEFSHELDLIKALYKQVASHPEIDESRVARVAGQLGSGDYAVDSYSVAEAVLFERYYRQSYEPPHQMIVSGMQNQGWRNNARPRTVS